jgi:hypothetical protein
MQLTPAQKTLLKVDMQANTNTTTSKGSDGQTFVINTRLGTRNPTDQQAIADFYNQLATPAYFCVRTDASTTAIRNSIQWPKYTPNPAITTGNAAQATAAAMYCQGKQFNLQLLGIQPSQAGFSFDASQATNTNGLKDATTNIPSAAAFANQDANWTGASTSVANQLVRQATIAEKVLSSANAVAALSDGVSAQGAWTLATASGNPAMFGAQGTLLQNDVDDLLLFG